MIWEVHVKKELEAVSCIRTVPIFKNLNEAEMDDVVMISKHQKLDKGNFLYQAGDDIRSLYVIHRGKIKIARYSEDGKEQVIRILSSGDFLGELALFGEAKVNTYAEAIEPSIICLVEHRGLKELMTKSPTLTFKMMNELSNRLEKAEALIEHSNLYSAEAKVIRLLLDYEKNALVRFTTTKVNLASNLGITPETFSRKLRVLADLEWIEILSHKTIKILNMQALKEKLNLETI